jgi:hypothetical protein
VVDACLTSADGHAKRIAALHMIEPRADRPQAITLAADKADDAEDFINELRAMKVTPRAAQNTSGRASASDGHTTRHAGYAACSASASGSKNPPCGSRNRRTGENQVPRTGARRIDLHLRGAGLQSGAAAQAYGGANMSPPASWRREGPQFFLRCSHEPLVSCRAPEIQSVAPTRKTQLSQCVLL